MRAGLERWLLVRWFGNPGVLWLALPLEWLYRGLFRLRVLLQAKPVKSVVPVIVVGNLAVGGSGKTPLVLALVTTLRARGLRVGVISRGYGGRGPFPLRVLPDTDPGACGDEPLLIARRMAVPVVVDPVRTRALAALVADGIEVVVSDDGLQHAALPRTVEIAVLDGRRGLGNGHCLPVGPLREPRGRLRQVDFVVSNGQPDTAVAGADVSAAVMTLVPTGFHRPGRATESIAVDAFLRQLPGVVHAVAGIGDPSRFFATLKVLGLAIEEHPFPDHHAYVAGDLLPMQGRTIVMTEKDAVKCAPLIAALGLDAWYLAVEARLPDDFMTAVLARAGLKNGNS